MYRSFVFRLSHDTDSYCFKKVKTLLIQYFGKMYFRFQHQTDLTFLGPVVEILYV